MAEEPGQIHIGVGPNPKDVDWLLSISHEKINNQEGSSGVHVNVPEESIPDSEIRRATKDRYDVGDKDDRGAQIGPEERVYIAIDADAQDQLNTSAMTVRLPVTYRNVQTGGIRTETFDISNRNQTPAEGGVNDDPYTDPGQRRIFYASPAAKSTEFGRWSGFTRVVTEDDMTL